MSSTVSQFKSKATKDLGGTTLNRIADFHQSLKEAAAKMLLRIDPYETRRSARIENAIYDKVYNYTAPTDLKGVTKIIDIRPVGERSTEDSLEGRFGQEFDIKKAENTVNVEMVNGVKTLRLSKQLTSRTVLHECNSTTLGGAVSASGDVSGLEVQTLDYISGSGSLQFDLSGATGQGALTFALENAIDLTDLDEVGALFHWLKFPLGSALTNVKVRWGNDASNYLEKTVTAPHDRSAFESNAWTLLRADWNTATETGTVDPSAVDWLQIEFNYTSGTARTNVRIDNITAAKGAAWEVVYYSNRIFQTSAGSYIATTTDDTDIIVLEEMAEEILYAELKKVLANEIRGETRAADIQEATLFLEGTRAEPGAYQLYQEQYPSEALQHSVTTYEFDDNLGF